MSRLSQVWKKQGFRLPSETGSISLAGKKK